MTAEIWTIIGVGIALALLILAGQRSLRSPMTVIGRERPCTDLFEEAGRIREPLAEAIESTKRMELIVGDVYQMVGLERPEPFDGTDRSHVVLVEGRQFAGKGDIELD